MKLHVEVHGQGDRTAVLLHGMMGSRESWWRVVPWLVASGYRVLGVDLPGLLAPALSVYIDAPFTSRGGWNRAELTAEYEQDKRARTYDGLRASRPFYSDQDCVVEARAAEHFDPATAASPATGPGMSFEPEPGSIIVRAKPSLYVDDVTAAHHESRGVIVRDVPGAAHSVWYSHFDQFVAALPEVFR